jgi:hypothetical protein
MAEVTDTAAVDAAFKEFADMVANDGYLLRWAPADDEKLVVTIDAGPDACADCLVPLPVMESILSTALEGTPYTLSRVVLPEGEGH